MSNFHHVFCVNNFIQVKHTSTQISHTIMGRGSETQLQVGENVNYIT